MNCGSDNCVSKPEWKWNNTTYDRDIYAHAFDQTNSSGIPYRHNSATSFGNNACTNDKQITHGKIEYTSTNISEQLSCNPNLTNPGLNAGNWYNFPAATAGSNNASTSTETNMPNSICPKGWQLPPSSDDKSYYNLIHDKYLITDTASDTNLLNNSAMSFVRLGNYYYGYGSLNNRGNNGYYWSSTASGATYSLYLYFYSGNLNPQNGENRSRGLSIRCVSR